MSNAKVRARRRRRANRAWTKAMDPVLLALTPMRCSAELHTYVEHTCQIALWVPEDLKKTAAEVLKQWYATGTVAA